MKKELIFTNEKSAFSLDYDTGMIPVINIIDALYTSRDQNWVDKLFRSSILVKIERFDSQDRFAGSYENPCSLGQFISVDHTTPFLSMNQTFRYGGSISTIKPSDKWKVQITLRDIELLENEKIVISYMDTKYISQRVSDWERRINNLYQSIHDWINDLTDYSVREGNSIVMNEGLMAEFGVKPINLPTLDLLFQNRIILSLKPKGLWVIGANGRIDVLSMKNGGIIIDKADHFATPEWYFIANGEPSIQKIFNKDVLLEIASL